MSDLDQMWVKTQHGSLPPKNSSLLSPLALSVMLFLVLLAVAIPALYFLPRLDRQTQTAQTNLEVPELMTNCTFFYQLCTVSSQGIVTTQSVSQLLTSLNSPLQQSPPLLYSEFNSEKTFEIVPSQIIALIAAKYNMNPFLILTLSEVENRMVTESIPLQPTVEAGGEDSGRAWFGVQHQIIASELQKLAQTAQLAPNTLTEKSKLKSVKIGTQEVKLEGDFSLATQIVVEYLASQSSTTKDLETKLQTFKETYTKLWGIDPSLPASRE